MATKEQHEQAFERWLMYEREVQLANTMHMRLIPPGLPPEPLPPNIVFPREALLSWRAAYVLLLNAVADLLDLDPGTMTQIQVIVAIAKRHWADGYCTCDDVDTVCCVHRVMVDGADGGR